MENNLVQHHRRCGKGATMIDVPHHDSGMDNIRHINLLIETTEDNNIRKNIILQPVAGNQVVTSNMKIRKKNILL